jgi:putative autotransporter adhesin-like protein
MKKRTIWIAVALLLCACGLRAVRGSGKLVTESRDVRDFDRVSLGGSGKVILIQGEEESLVIETDRNVMRYITGEVRDGTLVLGTKSGAMVSPTRLRFTVSVKDLAGLTVSGSGDLTAERVDTERLQIKVSGSGDLRIDALTAREVAVRISGSGDVDLAGEVTEQEVAISGSGKYRGGDLRSETVALTISGSGDATLWTIESLDARLSGSGSASYYGTPRTDISSSGSGNVKGLGDR